MKRRQINSLRLIAALAFVFALAFLPSTSDGRDLHGFIEGAYGHKTGDERAVKNTYNLADLRLQLKYLWFPESMDRLAGELFFKGELLADGYEEEVTASVRELNLFIRPADTVDLKAGRQVLTWGTGDFLFVNDLFPKDYVSFFTGREDEYLKKPSDALRLWWFGRKISLDLVLIPVFEPNRSIRGDRLSFYDGLAGGITGRDADRVFEERALSTENMEVAARAFRTFGSFEGALYFFGGFYKEPRGILDASAGKFFYPRLRVYGASLRGPLLGGIGSIEAGYYDSRDDPDGTDASVENSSVKYLAGFSRDLGVDFKAGVQYMVEQMLDYDGYLAGLSPGSPERDELRHLATFRLTRLLRSQTVEAGLFVFYSPTDSDAYLRPSLTWKVRDNLSAAFGANLFTGEKDHTEFGSLEGNNNIYTRLRYTF